MQPKFCSNLPPPPRVYKESIIQVLHNIVLDTRSPNFSGRQERNQQIIMFEEIYPRPQSVINIVEIPDSTESNPQPVNDTEKPLGEFISTQKLVRE